jgi:AcrR family transcriptional regulator
VTPRAGLDAEAVVAAAAELADRDGLDALTLARLAARLGVRAPSLYAHIGGGLRELRARLAARGLRELTDVMHAAAAGRAGGDALSALAEAYRSYALSHPGTYAALQRAPQAAGQELSAAPVEVVLAVLRGYGLSGEAAIHSARTIRSALHGFVSLEAGQGFGYPIDIDESYDWLVAVLHHGLAALPSDG